jgi:hypothetical protein
MIFSLGIGKSVRRDIENILQQATAQDRPRLQLTYDYLTRVELRENAQLKGEGYAWDRTFRKLTRGQLEVFYKLRPLDDRYAGLRHIRRVAANPEH